MRFFKKIFITIIVGMTIVIAIVLAINFYINSQSESYIFQNMNDLLEKKEEILIDSDRNKKEEIIIEKNVLLNVPFVSQAPFGNWDDARKQDGCEEIAVIMAMAWARKEGLTAQEADDRINDISAFEKKEIGTFHDTNVNDTVEIIFKKYFQYNNVEVKYNINKEDIKRELFKGNLIIVPTDGQLLGNPNYVFPGPTTHNLVVIGYNPDLKEFIVNDSGTKNGEKYHYKEDVLENALLDYPTGSHEEIEEIKTAMIIVKLAF